MRTNYTDEQFAEAIANNTSWFAARLALGLCGNSNSALVGMKKRAIILGIDYSHFGSVHKGGGKRRTWQEILIADRPCRETSALLRRALVEAGVLYVCGACGLIPIWNDQPLVLEVDHVNGNNRDNRLENLRFLCPNCHAQTSTYGSKNKNHKKSNQPNFCSSCGIQTKTRDAVFCRKCALASRPQKPKPTLGELRTDLSTMSFVAVGKKYGVTDNAIRKWIKSYTNGVLKLAWVA